MCVHNTKLCEHYLLPPFSRPLKLIDNHPDGDCNECRQISHIRYRSYVQMSILRGCVICSDPLYQKAMGLSYIKRAFSLYDQALTPPQKKA